MATILHIETATTNCSVCVAQDEVVLALKEYNTPNYSHSEQLHVFIQKVLAEASISNNALDAIAVSQGPGSYTGLRIGVSAAKGLCFALDVPLIAVSTLESMAMRVNTDSFDFIIPMLDARRMEVYSQIFDTNLNTIREIKAEIIDEQSFNNYVSQGKLLLLGSGAAKCKAILSSKNIVFDTAVVPSAKEMVTIANAKYQNAQFEDVAYFEPFYLKDFVLQQKAKKK